MQRTVYLKTTETCNLNCKHCFTSGINGKRIFWNVPKVKDWMKRFLEYIPKDDTVHFEFHGGEPMLADPRELFEVMVYGRSLSKNVSFGITTNLVYKLNDDHMRLLLSIDGVGTSWDPDIRFATVKQLELWQNNVDALTRLRQVNLFVSLSKAVTHLDIPTLLNSIKQSKFARVHFERITNDGNARNEDYLIPTNQEVNEWYMKLHAETQRLGARDWFENVTLEDVYRKFENNFTKSGTFCRDCETKIFTLNADGTIAGCANTAPTHHYSTIDASIEELFNAPGRTVEIMHEMSVNDGCLKCDVYQLCGGDCHKLNWDSTGCPAPKQLMRTLKEKQRHRTWHINQLAT